MAAANDIFRVVARVTLSDGQIAENVFHAKINEAADESDAKQDMVQWVDALFQSIESIQVNDVLPLDILVTNVTAGTATTIHSWQSYFGGEDTGDQLPPGVAALVLATTAIGRVLGRKFLPGIAEFYWNGVNLTGTAITALANFAVAWIAGFTGEASGASWLPGVLRTVGTFAPFVEAIVRGEMAYQRRRRQGVGI